MPMLSADPRFKIYVICCAILSDMGVKICLCAFTGARVLHSIVYLNSLQPWRTIMYALGSFSLVGLMVMSMIAILG
jgi:uncharacterized MAPEG superfamily protein